MAYNQNTWQKGDVITSTKLNRIEEGLAQSAAQADTNKENIAAQAEVDELHTQGIQEAKDAAQVAHTLADEAVTQAQQVQTKVNEVEVRVNDNAESIQVQAKTNATQAQEISELQSEIASQQSVDEQHTAGISQNASDIGSLRSSIDELRTSIESVASGDGADILDIKNTLEQKADTETVTALTSELENLKSVQEQNAAMDATRSENISELQTQLQENADADAQTATKVAENESNIQANAARIDEQQSVDEEHTASINALIERMTAAENAITELQNNSGSSSSSDSSASTEITYTNSRMGILESRVEYLEQSLANSKKTNIYTPSTEDFTAGKLAASDKDIVLTSDVLTNQVTTVTAQSVELKNTTVESKRLSLNTSGDVTLDSVKNTGTVERTVSNAVYSINASGDVKIKDVDFSNGATYNAIEIGLSNGSAPSSVLIENCTTDGAVGNNVVLVFNTADNAVVTIKNCTFNKVSNAIRLSNIGNVHVTLNVVDCVFKETESNLQYRGAILLQDYTSTDAEATVANNLFAPDKITINFINTQVDGKLLTADMTPASICATGDENQVIYAYGNKVGVIPFDASRYPTINII